MIIAGDEAVFANGLDRKHSLALQLSQEDATVTALSKEVLNFEVSEFDVISTFGFPN